MNTEPQPNKLPPLPDEAFEQLANGIRVIRPEYVHKLLARLNPTPNPTSPSAEAMAEEKISIARTCSRIARELTGRVLGHHQTGKFTKQRELMLTETYEVCFTEFETLFSRITSLEATVQALQKSEFEARSNMIHFERLKDDKSAEIHEARYALETAGFPMRVKDGEDDHGNESFRQVPLIQQIRAMIRTVQALEGDKAIVDWFDKHWHDWQKFITNDSDGWAYRLNETSCHEANDIRHAFAALATHSEGKGAGHFTKTVQAMVNTACDEDLHALTAQAIIGDLNKGNGHRPECRCATCSPPDDGGTKEGG